MTSKVKQRTKTKELDELQDELDKLFELDQLHQQHQTLFQTSSTTLTELFLSLAQLSPRLYMFFSS